MATDARNADPHRGAARPRDLFDQEASRVPSPRTPLRAPVPDAAETFPPSGPIPVVPPIFDQEDPAATRAQADPVRALGDAAVTGAVTGRGAFRASTRISPPPGAPAPGRPAQPSAKPVPAAAPMQSRHAHQTAPAWMSVRPTALVAEDGAGGGAPHGSDGTGEIATGEHEESRTSKRRAKHRSRGGGGGKPPKRPARNADDHVPFFRRLSTLIVIGLLVGTGAAALAATVVYKPEVLRLAPHVVNIPLPTPKIDPIVPTDPTPFLAGLPTATLEYALTDYQEMTLTERFEWVGRAAEGWVLAYGDGAGGEMTVTAYQHYTVDEAIAAFEEAAPPAPASVSATPSPEPSPAFQPVERGVVRVGDEVVGESVRTILPAVPAVPATDDSEAQPAIPERAQIMWRNGTAIFIMVAAPDVIDDLFTEYGV